VLAHNCLYGGTHDFLSPDFSGFGLSYSFMDAAEPDTWKPALRPNTKAIYVESITNPLMQVGDLKAVVAFAREHGLVSMIDGTFASPVNFRPREIGFDVVLHSCTKYLNGHNDMVGGCVIGSAELVERVRHRLNHLGGAMDPHACFLLHRGLKTLAVRVRYQNESAMKLARFLENHRAVGRVNYPGLESHPHHRRARDLFSGFSGMVSFELKRGEPAARKLLGRVRLPINAPSLGGPESLITQPARTSHVGMAPDARRRLGIADGLVRLSVGLEATDDLIADFEQALAEL
jgi:cystathionine beta-lyase/cystathionine gamma-synthase